MFVTRAKKEVFLKASRFPEVTKYLDCVTLKSLDLQSSRQSIVIYESSMKPSRRKQRGRQPVNIKNYDTKTEQYCNSYKQEIMNTRSE